VLSFEADGPLLPMPARVVGQDQREARIDLVSDRARELENDRVVRRPRWKPVGDRELSTAAEASCTVRREVSIGNTTIGGCSMRGCRSKSSARRSSNDPSITSAQM